MITCRRIQRPNRVVEGVAQSWEIGPGLSNPLPLIISLTMGCSDLSHLISLDLFPNAGEMPLRSRLPIDPGEGLPVGYEIFPNVQCIRRLRYLSPYTVD